MEHEHVHACCVSRLRSDNLPITAMHVVSVSRFHFRLLLVYSRVINFKTLCLRLAAAGLSSHQGRVPPEQGLLEGICRETHNILR